MKDHEPETSYSVGVPKKDLAVIEKYLLKKDKIKKDSAARRGG